MYGPESGTARRLVSSSVEMVQKQDGSSNGCSSNYTMIIWLGNGFTHLQPPTCHFRGLSCPHTRINLLSTYIAYLFIALLPHILLAHTTL